MLELFLLRHGKATNYTASGQDYSRKLDLIGQEEAQKILAIIKGKGFSIDQIISSKAQRALETAKIVNSQLNLKDIMFDKSLFLASDEIILDYLSLHGKGQKILYVGHNFGISNLVGTLTQEHLNMSTAMIVHIELNLENWNKISKNSGRIINTFIP